MRNILFILLLLSVAPSVFAREIVAVYPSYFPPYFIKDAKGKTQGMGIEIAEKLSEKTGVPIRMLPVSGWNEAVSLVKNGQADIILNIGVTEENSDFLRFSVPIDTSSVSIVTRRPYHIKSMEDLKGEVVAAAPFSVGYSLMSGRKDITLISNENPAGLLYLLMSGQADAVVFARPPVEHLISTLDIGKKVQIVEPPIAEIKRAIAVSAAQPELFIAINNELSDFVSTDEYRAIYDRWHKAPANSMSSETKLSIAIFLLALLVVIAVLWRFATVRKSAAVLKKAQDDLRQTKEALDESEIKFAVMADSISDIIWLTSPDLKKLLYINKAYETIYGKSMDSLYADPRSYLECIHKDDLPKLTLSTAGAEDGKSNVKYRVINNKTGKIFWVLSQYKPYKDKEGNVQFIAGIVSDITALVEAENEKLLNQQVLAQQSKFASMGEMIGSISHQWRQPLNTLYLCLQMIEENMEEKEPDKDAVKKYISDSANLIEHMSETIEDFRDFFKAERKPEPFDAPRTVQQILRMMSPQFKSAGINYHLDCRCDLRSFSCVNNFDPGNPPCKNLVSGISNEFKHAVLNILQNAKDALINSKSGLKDIFITMKSENGFFVISISDTAGGIPSGMITRMFDPFITGKEDGTGMGLYMTKTIIEEKMGGKLTAENTDSGARFTISLPVITVKSE